MTDSDDTVLTAENLTKSFNSVKVLSGVTLTLKKGVILGLAGENGAGKSTFAKCVRGLYKPDGGTLRLNGTCYVIPQEFTLISSLTVYENVFLGREKKKFGLLNRSAMRAKTKELLTKVGSTLDPDRQASSLSVAEKQILEIAKAFLLDSNLLIMDEPTTVLNKNETDVLFSIMRDFRARGGSIIYISHKLDELLSICDRIAVLRDGQLVSCDPAADLSAMEIARRMVGRQFSRTFPQKEPPHEPGVTPRLKAEHLSSGQVVKDVSFELAPGEILGFAGLAGSGRTELAETICALRRRTGGKIALDGEYQTYRTPGGAMRAGLSYLSEDRQGTGVLLDTDLTGNTTLGSMERYVRHWILRGKARRASTLEYIKRFGVKTPNPETPLRRLSGGNQQKVAIAKGLDTLPRVFIFDEPTRGVDVGARGEIYEFIHELARSGVSCLLISSDLEEVIGNCSRVLVMRGGELRGELRGEQVTEEEIMYLASGVK